MRQELRAATRLGLLTVVMTISLMHEARTQETAERTLVDAPVTTVPQVPAAPDTATHTGGFVPPDNVRQTDFSQHISQHAVESLQDQEQIWISPARTRIADATWLVPLGGIAAGLFATDRQYSASLSHNPATLSHYRTFSNVGLAGLVGTGAGLYLMSYPAHNEHWRETGFLAGEAALNSLVVAEAFKYSFRRERPSEGNGSGQFWNGGTSFPSEHAAVAWSIANVIAHEYPGTLPKLFAYGMASAVSFSRVHSIQHFPSDVFVGGVLGYLIAQNVYSRHHDPETGGGAWSSPHEFAGGDKAHSLAFMGSPYVPLDSWIYPALERLAALGYIKTASLGMRPWTRMECARLVGEASERAADGTPDVLEFFQTLSREFVHEIDAPEGGEYVHAQLESVYQRSLGIAGTPLTDGYHFGQTVLNDYGRPFQQGFNTIVGTSGWAAAGPFVIYTRGEYEYASSAPAPSAAVGGFISTADDLPPNAPSIPVATTSRFRLLDAYVGMNLANWQFSFGRQSLWWGPGESGTMGLTNNAEPMNMFRVNRVSPFNLPSILGYLGEMRLDFFLGQVSGQEFINNTGLGTQAQGQYGRSLNPQPFLSGAKVSFKFTENFEFNLSKTTLYGGPGNPLTPKTLLQSALGLHVNGEALGDGRSALDFSYRVPKLRNWLSLYGDAFQEDEISPLDRPYKAAFEAGLYLVRVPRISKLDLRVEGGTTSPINFPSCNGCYYHNFQYVNGYTNDGQLMGTWIGRAAQGESVRSNYWLSSSKRIGIELRHRKVDQEFLPLGGTQNDVAINSDFFTKSGFRFTGAVQYESWQMPLLVANRQSNLTASFQFGYWPQARAR